jgi:acetylornithine deacetylase/succinyl-diaminopimelate desuccinylase-like protein
VTGMNYAAAEAYLASHRERHLGELQDFLRIPSVSALPDHRGDVARAAEWLADRLRATGVPEVRIMPTDGHPVVYGAWQTRAQAPTILLYGHYDVQPVDPVALWQTPPFEPAVRDGRLVARGASDDKGSLFIPLAALDAIRSVAGTPALNLKFLFEGEEETGSPNLAPFLEAQHDLLRADVTVSADGGQWDVDTPALALGNRGLSGLQIDVRGAATDLHSGTYGGAVANPIHALAALLAGMHSPEGRVTVDGFYDAVRPVTPAERQDLARVPFDEAAVRRGLGVTEFVGEAEYTPLERTWIRPTLEVNGMWGGFQGAGTKTVLPNEAHAKITCRLVPDQDPDRIADAIERHLRRHAPPGVALSITRSKGKSRPYLMPAGHPALAAAAAALRAAYGRDPVRVRVGGTLPVAELVKRTLGTWLIFFAFGEPDNLVHAPNEFLRLQTFDRGTRAYVRFFDELAKAEPTALKA